MKNGNICTFCFTELVQFRENKMQNPQILEVLTFHCNFFFLQIHNEEGEGIVRSRTINKIPQFDFIGANRDISFPLKSLSL